MGKRGKTKTKGNVAVMVPSWVPEGHPHQWTADETILYDLNTDDMPGVQYRLLDDAVYGGRVCTGCDDPTCDFVVKGDWRPPVYDATVPFVVENFIPPGDPSDWSVELWQVFTDIADSLPVDLGNELDNLAWDRMSAMGGEHRDGSRSSWMSMSDKEYEELHNALEGDLGNSVDMTEDGTTGKGDTKPKCECGGPSSDSVGGTDKYTYHLRSCPAYNGKNGSFESKGQGGLVTKSKCLCSGPSHDGSGGNGQFPTHAITCEWSPAFKKGTSGPVTATPYVYKPTCKHDREGELFALENGLFIRPVSYRDNKFRDDEATNIGVYMYNNWQPAVVVTDGLDVPWSLPTFTQGVYIDWPDMGVPGEDTPVVDIVQWMLAELAKGVTFETGCMGGHGRTGTMLGMLLVAQGVLPGDAINRVRKDHCDKAIETEKQGRYLAEFYAKVHGNSAWKKSAKARKVFEKACEDGHKNYSKGTSYVGGGYSGKTWDAKTKAWVDKAASGSAAIVKVEPKADGYDEATQTYTQNGITWKRPQPFHDTKTGIMVVWCRASQERLPFADVWWDKVDGTYRASTYVSPAKVTPETQQKEV